MKQIYNNNKINILEKRINDKKDKLYIQGDESLKKLNQEQKKNIKIYL